MLSIGCGDGSVDVEIARGLAAAGPVDYRGIEPHAPSAQLFAERLGSMANVDVSCETAVFDSTGSGSYDLIIAVHSLYYVSSIPVALAAAHRMLAPGGRLIVLHAPRERLNSLVGVLAPGRTQEFADAVERVVSRAGWPVEIERIDGILDLSDHGEDRAWRDILDFTVQAVIPDGLIDAVEHALRAAALKGLDLAHPVDAFVIS